MQAQETWSSKKSRLVVVLIVEQMREGEGMQEREEPPLLVERQGDTELASMKIRLLAVKGIIRRAQPYDIGTSVLQLASTTPILAGRKPGKSHWCVLHLNR